MRRASVATSKEPSRGLLGTAKEGARSYCRASTVHGVSYVGCSETSAEQKVFWSIVVVAGITIGGLMVNSAFTEWAKSPVLTVIDTFGHPVEAVQFPTITVCSGSGDDPWDYTREYLNGNPDPPEELNDTLIKTGKYAYGMVDITRSRIGRTINVAPTLLRFLSSNIAPSIIGEGFDAYHSLMLMLRESITGESATEKVLDLLSLSMDWDQREQLDTWQGWIGTAHYQKSLRNFHEITEHAKKSGGWHGLDGYMREQAGNLTYEEMQQGIGSSISDNATIEIFSRMSFYEVCLLKYCFGMPAIPDLFLCYNLRFSDAEDVVCRLSCDCPEDDFDFVKQVAEASAMYFTFVQQRRRLGNFAEAFYKGFEQFFSTVDYTLPSLPKQVVLALLFHKTGRRDEAFDNLGEDDIKFGPEMVRILKSSLLRSGGGTVINDDGEFVPNYTDDGICLVHNGRQLSQAYNMDDRMEMVARVLNVSRANNPKEVANNTGSGRYARKTIWIDARSFDDLTKNGFAMVGVNNERDFFLVDSTGIEVYAGYEAIAKVKPKLHIADANLRDLAPNERRCRFADEMPEKEMPSMFQYYTQQSCFFECGVTLAAEKLNCTPWDFPGPAKGDICTNMDGSLLGFREVMRSFGSHSKDCGECLPSCEEVEFDTEVNIVHLDAAKLCADPDGEERRMAIDFWKGHHDPMQWRLSKLQNEAQMDIKGVPFADRELQLFEEELVEICKETITLELAKLTVVIPRPTIPVSKKLRRFTFADQLGTMGGTMGLFCGLSIISVVEVVFWVYKSILSFFGRP